MSDEREKLTPAQLLGIGGFVAFSLGVHVYRQAAKSPQQRVAEAATNRARHDAKRDYENRRRTAWKLDRDHWSAFKTDPATQAAFEAEYYVPVETPRASGTFLERRGGSLWDTWTSYQIASGDDTLTITHRHDGGYLSVTLKSPGGDYQSDMGAPDGRLSFGECDRSPSAIQRKVASLIRAIQAEGFMPERKLCLTRRDRRDLIDKHYAHFAGAHGWPPEKDGEVKRTQQEWYRSGGLF